MSLEHVAKLASLVQKDRYVAVVSFRTACQTPLGGGPPEPSTIKRPKEERGLQRIDFHVEGDFALIEKIHLAPPALGCVSGDIRVEMQWGGDEVYERVRALDADWKWKESNVPRTVLAVEREKGKGILDAGFFGPFLPGGTTGLREFVAYLLAHPFEKIPQADAEALAVRPNVWMCLLGLARLESLQVHASKVFFEAMRRVPVESVPGILTDLVDYTGFFKEAEKQEVFRQLAAFVDTAEPARQLALLHRLIWLIEQHQFDQPVVMDDLFKAMRKQAEARAGQKEWADVVARYQKLLGLLKVPEVPQTPMPIKG